jgi:hypothetical protein
MMMSLFLFPIINLQPLTVVRKKKGKKGRVTIKKQRRKDQSVTKGNRGARESWSLQVSIVVGVKRVLLDVKADVSTMCTQFE